MGALDCVTKESSMEVGPAWMPVGNECKLCKKVVSREKGGVVCRRLRLDGTVSGCNANICWRCMKRVLKEEIGSVRCTMDEFEALGVAAWWMHEKCMTIQDKEDYFGAGNLVSGGSSASGAKPNTPRKDEAGKAPDAPHAGMVPGAVHSTAPDTLPPNAPGRPPLGAMPPGMLGMMPPGMPGAMPPGALPPVAIPMPRSMPGGMPAPMPGMPGGITMAPVDIAGMNGSIPGMACSIPAPMPGVVGALGSMPFPGFMPAGFGPPLVAGMPPFVGGHPGAATIPPPNMGGLRGPVPVQHGHAPPAANMQQFQQPMMPTPTFS